MQIQYVMLGLRLRQLLYEVDTWKRFLLFIMGENAHLKSRLSEVLKENSDPALLEDAEQFQNKFIQQDERIRLLRNDVAELDKLLHRELTKGASWNDLTSRLEHLRTNLSTVERTFVNLMLEFNRFMQLYYTTLDKLKI